MSLLYDLSLPLSPEFCWLLTMCLIHTFWQGTIIAIAVAVIVRPHRTVHQRFVIAFGSLVLIGMLPICNYAWLTSTSSTPAAVEKATEQFFADGGLALFKLSDLDEPAPQAESQIADQNSIVSNQNVSDELAANEAKPLSRAEKDIAASVPWSKRGWTVVGPTVITFFYLAGALAMVLRLGLGLKSQWQLTNVCKRMGFADQVPHAVITAAEQAARSLSRKLKTPIAMFNGDGVALVVGCLRPVILINTSLVSGLTPTQMEQILAHELAHVYRFDPMTQLAQRLIESLLFFHPGVWYVSREVSDLRELCCDEMATQNYSKIDFAETLLQCAVLSRSDKASRYSLAAMGSHSSQLTSRIDALLRPNRSSERHKARRWSDFPATTKVVLTLVGVLIVLVAIRTNRDSNRSPMQILSDQSADDGAVANPVLLIDLDWQWITEKPEAVTSSQFLFGGKQLSLIDSIPDDIDVQAMVDEDACEFAQWHFGDSSSTRVAILIEMNDNAINRLFIDRNRDRIIDDGDVVTVKANGDKTWLTDLDVEVHENGSVVRAKRQIGVTPHRDRTKLRITTLGFVEGQIEVDDKTYQARRVDKDGDGLPTGKRDQIWIDIDDDGQFDKLTERLKLDSTLRINEARYLVRSDRLGQSLALTPDDKVGFVQFLFELADKTATLEMFEGSLRDESGMLIAVGLHEEPTPVPVGRYCLQDLVVQVRDKDSAIWRMTLSRGLGDNWNNINPDKLIEINQDATQEIRLLEDLNFTFVSKHDEQHYSQRKTQLSPSIRTKNGLVITDFTKLGLNEKPSLFNENVTAKFKLRNAKDGYAAKPQQCSSGFG